MKILVVVGTRPEAIKMAPVVRRLRQEPSRFEVVLCVTAQHRQMLDQVLDLFELAADVDLDLMRPDQSPNDLSARAFAALDRTTPLGPLAIDRREPEPHDVQIDILFCGVCHSDLHTVRSEWPGTMYPCVPGHEIAGRVNRLLDEVEAPMKAFLPQVTRTLAAADMMVEQLAAPIERVAPGLARLADTLSSPQLTALPKDLGEFMNAIGDLARRMQPLSQLAESAGGLFGLRPLASMVPWRWGPTPWATRSSTFAVPITSSITTSPRPGSARS